MLRSAPFHRAPTACIVGEHECAPTLESVLRLHGYDVVRALRAAGALTLALEPDAPDVFLIPESPEDMSPLELCRALRACPSVGPGTPIVLLAAAQGREERLEALRTGAWDLLGIPVDAQELVLRLDRYVSAKLTADRRIEEGLVDQLTGLYNLQGLVRRVSEIAAGALRHHRPLACVVIAPEDRPADAAGPADLGAEALRTIANALRTSTRLGDAIGRLSEQEFAIVAPDTPTAGALELARRFTEEAMAQLDDEDTFAAGLRFRAGCYAVEDFGDVDIQPAEMLARASLALRDSQLPASDRIRFFGAPPASMNN
jgi:diguanylate cyclase (GGDEF)-like protein